MNIATSAMNLQCPNCQAEYAVPSARLSEHAIVRCGACDHTWTIGDAEDDQDTTDPEAPAGTTGENDDTESEEPIDDAEDQALAPIAMAESVKHLSPPLSTSPAPDRWLAAAWTASATAIAACVIAACLYRASVAAAWPPAGRLFAINRAASIESIKAPRPDMAGRGEPSKP
jgi:predicted Zn finger-like uncharacterized protein